MKKILFAASALLALSVSSAQAADPVMEAMYDWSGIYVGLNAGYAFGDHEQFDNGGSSGNQDYDGFAGGLQIGYNFQHDSIVLGVESDIQFSDIDGEFGTSAVWGCGASNSCSSNTDWFGTARVRIGFAADNFLPYLTGGLAYGDLDSRIQNSGSHWDLDDIAVGWTIGGGVEVGITESLSAKLEYLYVDLGKVADSNGLTGFEASADFSVVRVGVNYQF